MTLDNMPLSIQSELDPSMLIGVSSIDAEHLALVAYLDRLTYNQNAEPHSEQFSEIYSRLGELLQEHFDSE